ncbi:MAG: hypothetical protein V7K84_10085 [Nostoc sp.]
MGNEAGRGVVTSTTLSDHLARGLALSVGVRVSVSEREASGREGFTLRYLPLALL